MLLHVPEIQVSGDALKDGSEWNLLTLEAHVKRSRMPRLLLIRNINIDIMHMMSIVSSSRFNRMSTFAEGTGGARS